MKIYLGRWTLILIAVFALEARAEDFSSVLKLGGETSILLATPTVFAYKNPAQNLNADDLKRHTEGDKLFERKFSDDPMTTYHGLGPVFNNISCNACHVVDGRGALPLVSSSNAWTKLGQNSAIFLRVSLEGEDLPSRPVTRAEMFGGPHPVPGFGTQLFQSGVFSLRNDFPGTGQADVLMRFEMSTFQYPDGTTVQLRKPLFKIEHPYDAADLGDSALGQAEVRLSPRMTPPMIGLGLLDAIKEEDILALAQRDLSSWGVHGHPNWVYDLAKDLNGDPRPVSLGRFGLKASTPSVFQQTHSALNGDMGVTTNSLPFESIWETPLFEDFKSKWTPGVDLPEESSDLLVFYSQTLAVPARRNIEDVQVRSGAETFLRIGCAACHQPTFTTGLHSQSALSHQKIYPFTDMLLHDMGEGLADHRQDFQAGGRDWKTRPLWGIGVTQVVNQRAGFLHDGRARTLEEAILWHGGEAEIVLDNFVHLSLTDRQNLVQFLKSL